MSAAGILFFISWLICGCCIDGIFEDRRLLIVVLIALIVALLSGLRIIREEMQEGQR